MSTICVCFTLDHHKATILSHFSNEVIRLRLMEAMKDTNLQLSHQIKFETCSCTLQLAPLKLSIKISAICCNGSLQGCHQKNIQLDCNSFFIVPLSYLRAGAVGTVGKSSAFQPQGPQFNRWLCQLIFATS